MEIFDPITGHILPGDNQASRLEFLFKESGYIAPDPDLDDDEDGGEQDEKRKVNPAGYQKFTIFARASGRQRLRFAFVKPWLPDEQFDRTDAIIEIEILEGDSEETAAGV